MNKIITLLAFSLSFSAIGSEIDMKIMREIDRLKSRVSSEIDYMSTASKSQLLRNIQNLSANISGGPREDLPIRCEDLVFNYASFVANNTTNGQRYILTFAKQTNGQILTKLRPHNPSRANAFESNTLEFLGSKMLFGRFNVWGQSSNGSLESRTGDAACKEVAGIPTIFIRFQKVYGQNYEDRFTAVPVEFDL